MRLHSVHPFIFRDTVFSHGWLRMQPFRWEEEAAILSRIERLPGGRTVELRFSSPAPESLGAALDVEVAEGDLSAAEETAVLERARWIFGLDEDLTAFEAYCATVPG